MSKFLNEKYRKLESYTPGEQPQGKTFIKLNTNESPYPPGPAVQAAVNSREAQDLRLYSDPESRALKEKLAELHGMKKENIFVSNGSDEILNFAFMAFAGGETGVMFPEISYGFYEVFADLYQLDYRKVPLKEDFSIDPLDYVCQNRMIVIANPNAPTGRTLTVHQIEDIVRTNPETVVVIDEAYVDFGAESCRDLIFRYDNLLVVQTFSKSRSLAGGRLGFAMAQPGLISDLEKIKFSTNPYNVNRLTAAAGIAALSENGYYMENCRKIGETREMTAERLAELGFETVPSEANFIFVRSDRISGGDYYRRLREKGILVRHFDKEAIADYNRVTIGTREEMEKFLDATREILEEVQQ
ncbi:MAG: histidinol-phosphate transaminase [Emergencia sp.]